MGGALAKNTATLLVSRFLAGTFGSSRKSVSSEQRFCNSLVFCEALTNAGGAISDMWVAKERGVAVALYSVAPFLGPGKAFQMYGFDCAPNQ